MTDTSTRERILQCASDVFVDKGFENTTIREICALAEANVSAVNYYFGDKRNLYNQVLVRWMEEFIENGEYLHGITPESSPEERLRTYVRADIKHLCTYLDYGKVSIQKSRFLLREITADDHDPAIFKCHIEFEEKVLYPLIKELLDGIEDPKVLEQAVIAATGMLTHYFIMVIHDPKEGIESEQELETLTDFITDFILGGLAKIKEKHHA